MKIENVVVGLLNENCYILSINNKVLVIDPGDEIDKIKKVIGSREVLGVLITHKHFDHIGALSYFDTSIIYSLDNLSERKYDLNGFNFEVIFTPGHSSDSVSYYFKNENILFCGDFIFYENMGRCDLDGGSIKEMKSSIIKIKKYPKDMIIYPGHGPKTSLYHELEKNKYFKEV